MRDTMFDRYGLVKVTQMVSAFYSSVLRSPRLGPYFEGVDMRGLIDHQAAFMAAVMGGPTSYTNEELEQVHSRLGITADDFDEMMRLLRETLERHRIDPADVAAISDGYTALKPVIVRAGHEDA